MKLIGKTEVGAVAYERPANTKRVARFYVPRRMRIPKLTGYVDGYGSGQVPQGEQKHQAIIYSVSTGAKVAEGVETPISEAMPAQWVDFPFGSGGAEIVEPGWYDFGTIAAEPAIARFYGDVEGSEGSRENTDAYTGGASATFGAATLEPEDMSIFATFFESWVPPPAPERLFARLPWPEAQEKFSETGPIPATALSAVAVWHGNLLDGEDGAFAVVNPDGELGDYLGERVRVTYGHGPTAKFVYVLVHNEADFVLGDISLHRRAFLALAPLALDELDVVVEAMS